MLLYLDANAIVYLLEGAEPLREKVLPWIDQVEGDRGSGLLTSCLSLVECRLKPLRLGHAEAAALYQSFFSSGRVHLADVTRAVAEEAVVLGARHGFRSADAIHLATAMLHRADVFLTADRDFRRVSGTGWSSSP